MQENSNTSLLATDYRCRGGGLRRHRHERALCHEGGVRLGTRVVQRGQRLRNPVHLLLDPDRHRFAQVRRAGPAGRQQRRGWARCDAGTGVGGGERQAQASSSAAVGGHLRNVAVLRRRCDHSCHLRAVCGRRPGGHIAGVEALGDSADARHPVVPVLGAEARHSRHRPILRTGDAGVVRDDRGARRFAYRPQPEDPASTQSASCVAVHVRQPRHHLHHPGRGRPVRHRCRGAVCGPGALRQETDPARVVLRRHAVIDVELLRPRCVAACQSRCGRRIRST